MDHVRGAIFRVGLSASLLRAAAWTTQLLLVLSSLVTGCGENVEVGRLVLETIAGSGNGTWDGEGKPALESTLFAPLEVVFSAEGRPRILDWNNLRVRELSDEGKLITILGDGKEGSSEANVPATAFSLHHALDLDSNASGELFVAGYHDPRILKVDAAGRVRVVAGLGTVGHNGDGGPAQLASLIEPTGVTVAPDGTVFFSDSQTHRIHRVDPEGTIHDFAGNGEIGRRGDGGPATEAALSGPTRLAYDASSGDLYFCDSGNHQVRKVSAAGMISLVAGDGTQGFSGDGGAAVSAQLDRPIDLELLDDGSLLIADSANHRIRRVAADGIIETIAGNGETGFPEDALPPLESTLLLPYGIALDAEGRLWIADSGNNRLRRTNRPLFAGAKQR